MCLVLVWISMCSALYSVFVQPTYTGCRTALASIQLPILTAGSFDTGLPQRGDVNGSKGRSFVGSAPGQGQARERGRSTGKASCRRSATNRAAVRIKRTHAIIGAHYGVCSLFLLAAYVTNVRNIDTLFEKEQGYFYLNSVRSRCGLQLSAQRYIRSAYLAHRVLK
ncbi:hypothetical protein CI102_275 [Trichoderma harzianum]|nr:hypothetical protein CI102_275 [Trichoderma harzianum]